MRMQRVGIAAAGIVAAVGLVIVGAPVGYFLVGYGCGADEERLGEALARDPVLDDGPDGAEERESYQECDDDDLFVVAGKAYAYEGESRESVLVHYRDAAQAHGWRHRVDDCFSKRIDGTVAYLSVEGLADGAFEVSILADRDDTGSWC